MNRKKVIIGLSGGIDSAASAYRLQGEGYEVIGVTFNFLNAETTINAAKLVAEKLKIEHHVLAAQNEFQKKVINPFVAGYRLGKTPNPCLLCNQNMKFKLLRDFATANGDAMIATGHYAEVRQHEGAYQLWASPNANKDQSYFLYHLDQDILGRLLFPLNAVTSKDAVRKEILRLLPELAQGAESQGICFIPKKDHGLFLKEAVFGNNPTTPGNFVDKTGRILGKHLGIHHFTPGQTRGLGITGEKRLAVVEVIPATNTVVLDEEQSLYQSRILVDALVIQSSGGLPETGFTFKTCRWGHEYDGQIERLSGTQAIVHSQVPVRAPAPGQALVFYQGRRVLGGGIIKRF
ncbi:tRNA 2-thiouridine(34) synthase MnmA [Acetobacterium wieringae]|uniref:tRNA 2-thiouridine(34) synthase MnmA n=1 Tax=Acetobacterium wieringae TaxID=52694 RepID=UPI0026EDC4B2|nr:tRNA 2-thiouridine(34) synthase MnmA [Acetobacterium wieringae]